MVKTPKIAVVGVGGCGGEVLNIISKSDIADDVKLVAVNGDHQALESCTADVKIKLPRTNRGLTPVSYPHHSKEAALEVYEEIKEALMQ